MEESQLLIKRKKASSPHSWAYNTAFLQHVTVSLNDYCIFTHKKGAPHLLYF